MLRREDVYPVLVLRDNNGSKINEKDYTAQELISAIREGKIHIAFRVVYVPIAQAQQQFSHQGFSFLSSQKANVPFNDGTDRVSTLRGFVMQKSKVAQHVDLPQKTDRPVLIDFSQEIEGVVSVSGGQRIIFEFRGRAKEFDEKEVVLQYGKKKLTIKIHVRQNKVFLQMGSRTYKMDETITSLDIQDVLNDPLLWIGNAELIEFYGEDAVLESRRSRGPPLLSLVEWNKDLRNQETSTYLPQAQSIKRSYLEHAYQRLKDPSLDPILKSHYALVVYFFNIADLQEFPLAAVDIFSYLGQNRANEFLYGLFGISDALVPSCCATIFM